MTSLTKPPIAKHMISLSSAILLTISKMGYRRKLSAIFTNTLIYNNVIYSPLYTGCYLFFLTFFDLLSISTTLSSEVFLRLSVLDLDKFLLLKEEDDGITSE